jgi:DNA-directed RNA polymerase sigma subunit (sigma70/sigma32)
MTTNKRLDVLSKIFNQDEKVFIYWHFGFSKQGKLSLDKIASNMKMSRTKVTKIRNKVEGELKNNPDIKEYFQDFI